MTDGQVTIPADLVRRVRDANAVWVATIGPVRPGVTSRAKYAAMEDRSAAVRELLAFVVAEPVAEGGQG